MPHNSTFGFDRPEDSPGFLLWQTTVIWQRLIKQMLEIHEISHAQFVIMALLLWFDENDQKVNQVTIARFSKLDKMTVSKSLKKLVDQGYINRSESQTDTRANWVNLTEDGQAKVMQLVPLVEGIDEQFFSAVSTADQHQLIRHLNTLVRVFSSQI